MTLTNLDKAEHDLVLLETEVAVVETAITHHTTTALDECDCDIYLDLIKSQQTTLPDIHRRILNTKPSDTTTYTASYTAMSKRILKARSFLEKLKKTLSPSRPTSSPTASRPTANHSVRLPKLDLPKFSGNYEDWQSFQDMFTNTIMNNSSISDAEKFTYLRQGVQGDAAQLIKSFTITDLHFKEAWNLLEKRYNNKKEIVQSLIRRLLNQQQIKSESATVLQKLQNTTTECLRSLKVLGIKVDEWDSILVVIITDKMDSDTRAEWAKYHKGTDPPTFSELDTFLNEHIRSLIARGNINSKPPPQGPPQFKSQSRVSSNVATSQKCNMCHQAHPLYFCDKFKSMSINDKHAFTKSKNLCFNCLRPGHSLRECKSTSRCKICSKSHNTLLHRDQQTSSSESGSTRPSTTPPPSGTITCSGVITANSTAAASPHVLLKTIKFLITDNSGEDRIVRAVLDECSQASYITKQCADALGLPKRRSDVIVTGVGGNNTTLKYSVNFMARSRLTNQCIPVQAYIMHKITSDLERLCSSNTGWAHINDISLADPEYMEPGRIDVLLGADIAAEAIQEGLIKGTLGFSPTAQKTIFGWVLFGRVQSTANAAPRVVASHISKCDLDQTLRRFWELEETPRVKHLTEEETLCENHFRQTTVRDAEGRYTCRLPFNSKKPELGESKKQALLRFKLLEKRFNRQPEVKAEYVKFMKEYLDLNHMEVVPVDQEEDKDTFYLPHHCVVREDSLTTKLRVVFDGSAKTSTGVSLNDSLMIGPVVQDDLFSIILRFRMKPIAVKGDVAKMYRQFKIPQEDANYLRVFWRENETDPLRIYRLTTVTYGTSAAPYQATRCLKQLADDEGNKYPLAAETLRNNTYVDDILSCAQSSMEGLQLHNQLNSITKSAGMFIRKWSTNDKTLLEAINPNCREQETVSFDNDSSIKALGIRWNPGEDTFIFNVSSSPPQNVTKRIILSELAKVFDPVGWLSPVTINAKIIYQELWKCKLDWDEAPQQHIIDAWNSYQLSLSALTRIKIPRCIVPDSPRKLQLLVFSDSSSKAYSACVYLRVETNHGVSVNLITAKTRVAPIQQQSIPRLELCGAELACDLVTAVKSALQLSCEVYGFTDSTIVLHWLASYPGRWQTFIANRVAKIQQTIPFGNWKHVKSEENPADCASRGIPAEELINNSLWWNGPVWCTDLQQFPSTAPPNTEFRSADLEEKKIRTLIATKGELDYLFAKYSTLTTLVRITALVRRFISNFTSQSKATGAATVSELQHALLSLIKIVQRTSFSSEISTLAAGGVVKSGKLNQLNPFVDHTGVLRVGGRLHHANIAEETKHPIVLPSDHIFTTLIIRNCHFKNFHSGLKLTLSSLQQNYWILRGRDRTRQEIRKCIICRKQRAELSIQLMGSLPTARVNPSRPFSECGLDYAGAFSVRLRGGRGNLTVKCYFSIFVCLSTKAIHLECVDSLSTADFIACFKRFCARRGIPTTMYSDNGTTFVGADRELKELLDSATHQEQFQRGLGDHGTNWIFNPPSAPHQGGLWEAGVKAVKYHIRRTIGSHTPTKKEFETLLCQIESCVNSRPLCVLSSDPSDINVLTPGHFLVGGPLNAIPEPDLTRVKVNRLTRWQQTQQMFQHFWRRWQAEYLTTLQQRFKWKTKRGNLEVGDIVIIKEDNCPPMKWRLGRIIATHPGQDGLVRVATVKTANNELNRPIAKLCPIISNKED